MVSGVCALALAVVAVAFAVTRDGSSGRDGTAADAAWRDRVITGPTTSGTPAPSTSSGPTGQVSPTAAASVSSAPTAHAGATPAAPASPAPAATPSHGAAPVLAQLVAQRVVLSDRLAQAVVRADDRAVAEAEEALESNASGLQASLAKRYGAESAAALTRGWDDAVTRTKAYARALAAGDSEQAASARTALTTQLRSLPAVLATSAGGTRARGIADPALASYANQVTGHVDAYVRKDFARAYAIEREAYASLYALGDQLASPGRVSPRHQFRNRLRLLLSEHAVLAADVMRSGLAGWPEFPAAGAALNTNTRQLGSAVEALLGDRAAREFAPLWAEHVDGLVAYVRGQAQADAAAKTAARTRLVTANRALGEFFARFTDGRLTATAVAPWLHEHDEMLLRQIDLGPGGTVSVQARPYADVPTHAQGLADVLARGINATVSARSPRGGAETGWAGTPTSTGRR